MRRAIWPRTWSPPGLADRCTIQLSYAIGVAKPLSIYADLHGTGEVDPAELETTLMDVMDLTPRGIRSHLGLNRRSTPAPRPTAISAAQPGHDGGFSWERTDLAPQLKSALA